MELNKWHQNISLKPAICKPVNPMSHFLVGGKKIESNNNNSKNYYYY